MTHPSSQAEPPSAEDPGRVLEILKFHLVNSPLGVVEWDSAFRVKSWSGRAEELFGWREDELLGKHPDDWRFVHDDDQEDVAAAMGDLLSSAVPRNISLNRNYTKDGRVVACEWYNSVLTDADGRLVSVLSLIQDVTERKAAEEQVLQLQKMEVVSQLTGGVAHDFNNLLTVILGLGDLALEALEGQPEPTELVREMLEAGRRGAVLTHDLLAFARKQPLEPRATDVDELVSGLTPLLRRTLGEQIELTLATEAQGRLAEVDPGKLESAALNLCINARDAMSAGGRLILETEFVRIDREAGDGGEEIMPGDYVVLAISDTGSGIAPEHRDKVFDPFFTTKGVGKGSGLGLSMVYGFVKQSRGEVRIYSEVDRGTTVRLYLPVSLSGSAEAEGPVAVQVPTGTEAILVVEDDDLVRSYAELQLRALGYRANAVPNGPGALEVLASPDPVDLLFTDVIMPGGIDGPELARRARELRPGLRVLFTSGYTENAIVHQGRLDPGVLLLSKPYQRGSLARKIREAIEAPAQNGG